MTLLRLLLLLLFVSGCPSSRLDEPGVLVISQEQQASWTRNFNPFLASGMARWATRAVIYEPLFIYNRLTQKYTPWLGTEYTWNEDGTAVDVTIRQGVRWSDGVPLTANDVAFTFNYIKQHKGADTGALWSFLSSVDIVDEHTVRFTFQRVYTPGFHAISQSPIVPQHIWQDIDTPLTFTNETPVATGPYIEIDVFETQLFEMKRNPLYWQPANNPPKRLRFPALITNDQANLALIRGEVDWAGNFLPAAERIFVAPNPEHHNYWFPAVGGSIYLYPNHTRPPLNDRNVRKALSLAIDRQLLLKVAMYEYAPLPHPTGLTDGYLRWRLEDINPNHWVQYDPERAGQMLDAAGWTRGTDGIRVNADGQRLSLTLQGVSGWSDWVRAVQVISRNLRTLGVDVHLVSYDFGAWFHRTQTGDFDLTMGWADEGPAPYDVYKALMSPSKVKPIGDPSPNNWHRFGAPEMTALEAQFEQTTEFETQHNIGLEMQRIFLERAPAIPLFAAPAWGESNSTRFTGFPSQDNPYARLSPNHPPETLLVLTALEAR